MPPNVFADANDVTTMLNALRAQHAEVCNHLNAALSAGRADAAALLTHAADDIEARIVRWAGYESTIS